jgi:hypothetical protein
MPVGFFRHEQCFTRKITGLLLELAQVFAVKEQGVMKAASR